MIELAPDVSIVFPILVVGMMLVAVFGGRDRRRLVSCAIVLAGGWLFFIASFSNHPPAEMFWSLGAEVRSESLWSVSDAVQSVMILAIAHDRRWGWMLWGILTAGQPLHLAYEAQVVEYSRYSYLLDLSFLAQLAVVFVIGGPGVRDLVIHRFYRRRDVRGSTPSASARS